MLFDLQLLGKPDAAGNAGVIENRTLAAASIEEAVRTAKNIVLNTPVPGVYGFRLLRSVAIAVTVARIAKSQIEV
jgi:hypothetical protein